MGFSSHEIYMILRARNEASGVLHAFARALNSNHKTQMDQYRENIKGFEEKKAAIREGLRDQLNAADGVIQKNREEIAAIGRAEDAVRSKYRTAINANKEQITELSALKREYNGMIDTYSKERDGITASQKEFTKATTAKVSDVDKLIRANRNSIDSISAERDTIKSVRDVHTEKIKSQVAGIDAVIKENGKLAAAYTADAREWGRLGAEKTAQYKKEIADIQSISGASQESTRQIVATKKRAHDSWMNQMRAEQRELGREADKFREHSRELTRRKEVIQASSREFLSSLDAESANLDKVKSRIVSGNHELGNKRAAVIDAGKAFKQSSDAEIAALSKSIDNYKDLNTEISNEKALLRDVNTSFANARDTELDALRKTKQGYQDKISTLDKIKAKFKQNADVAIMAQDAEIAKTKKAIETHQAKLDRLQGLGQAYMMAGTTAVVAGGMMIKMYLDAGSASREYSKAAALTFTQVDKDAQGHALVTQQAIINMGKRVARDWPVEFSQIQPAMYDVFSSMDIKSAEIGEKMMNNIAKAAVAGSVEVATAGKGIIEVINAWGMEMDTAADAARTLNRVNDVAFTLVKEGVGSYGQFSDAIGRSIPSAVKAGASYEDMAGGLAFLTRMGMSTTMASTSMGRAFDLISNPRFAANMKKYGLEVADANGKIKPMTEIVNDLQGKMKGMTEVEAAAFLKNVTLGAGGTVQAMRFLSHATHDNANLFDSLTQSMYDASEAGGTVVGNAYDIMANTPAAKIRELANQFEIFKITVGDTVNVALMPLINALTQALDWFNNLSPGMQQTIVVVGMVMGGLLLLGGAILLIGGLFYMLAAAAASTGLALSAVFLPVTLVIAGIAALIAIIILVINYWPQISAAAAPVFDMLKSGWDAVVSAVQGFADNFLKAFDQFSPYFDALGKTISGAWEAVMRTFDQVLNNPFLTEFFGNLSLAAGEMGPKLEGLKNAFEQFGTAVGNVFGIVVSVLGTVFTALGSFISLVVSGIGGAVIGTFMGLWAGVQMVFAGIVDILTGVMTFITGVFTLNWQMMGDGIVQIVTGLAGVIGGIFSGLVSAIIGFVVGLVQGVIGWFTNLYDVLVGHSIIPDMVKAIIDWISKLPGKVIAFVVGLVNDFIAKATEWATKAKAKAGELVTGVVQFISTMPGKVLAFIVTLVSQFTAKASEWVTIAKNKASELVSSVVSFMSGLPGKVIAAIASLAGSLAAKGTEWMNSLRNAVSSGWNAVNGFFRGIPGKIISAIGGVGSLLTGIGRSIIDSFFNGLKASWGKVTDFIGGIAAWIRNNKGPIEKDRKLLIPAGEAILTGLYGGLQRKFGSIKSMVADVNKELLNIGDVPAKVTGVGPVDGSYLARSIAQNSPPPVNNERGDINIEVHTQEIDPVKHAADLGYLVGSKLGW